MKQIADKLWVGSADDFKQLDAFGTEWAILHAAKTQHKAICGYTTNAAPKDAEYYSARRGKRLALNMIDAPKPEFFHKPMVDEGIAFIAEQLASIKDPDQVLIACDKGQSRAPSMGMLYLAPSLPEDFEAAEAEYRAICPQYQPANGIREFARANWAAYRTRKATQQLETSDPDLDKARELYERFCETLKTDPKRARDELISSIVAAFKGTAESSKPAPLE